MAIITAVVVNVTSARLVRPVRIEGVVVKYLIAIGGVLAVIASLVVVKGSQISMLIKAGEEGQKAGPPPEFVSTLPATKQSWEGLLQSVGTVAPVKGVTVSNEVPGTVTQLLFESGALVAQGQPLVVLDSRVERAQLAAAKARRELADTNVGRSRTLAKTDTISKAELDNDEAQLKSSGADMDALAAQIERKTIRAPFSGRLGIRLINLGQYLDPGTAIAILGATESVYVDFTVPQQRLADVKVGTKVRVELDTVLGATAQRVFEGSIAAVDPVLDPQTRAAKLRVEVPNKSSAMRPGMFARVSVLLPSKSATVTVPATAVIHAAYGDSVFVVESPPGADPKAPKVARQQFVRVGDARGDFVAITEGVKEGQEVVVAGAFKLRNGASVIVNNSVKVEPQLSPRPENR